MIFNFKINSIFETITIKFKSIFNRENSNNIKIAKQINLYQGLTSVEAIDLVNKIVDQKLIGFKSEAEDTFTKRTEEFKNKLLPQLAQLKEQELDRLREPDTILALKEATEISGRKTNPELRQLLANLVIGRIKNANNNQEELKNLVYNESINTIAKLTPDQLKIITLCYLLKYTTNLGIADIQSLDSYLSSSIKPFIDFKDTLSQFQHIEYAGCGSIGEFGHDLVAIIRDNYSYLFKKEIDPEIMQTWNIPKELQNKVIQSKEGKIYFMGRNKKTLDDFLKEQHIEEEQINKIINYYDNQIYSTEEVKKVLIENTTIGKQLLDIWGESVIKNVTLTSVGIVIGATNYEQLTGQKLNIDIWIN